MWLITSDIVRVNAACECQDLMTKIPIKPWITPWHLCWNQIVTPTAFGVSNLAIIQMQSFIRLSFPVRPFIHPQYTIYPADVT